MTHEVGPKGQVVIPKELRDVLGIEPGDEVTFWRDGDHVAVRPVRSTPLLRGRFATVHSSTSLSASVRPTALAYQAILLTGDPELLPPGAPWAHEDLRSS